MGVAPAIIHFSNGILHCKPAIEMGTTIDGNLQPCQPEYHQQSRSVWDHLTPKKIPLNHPFIAGFSFISIISWFINHYNSQ